MSPPDFEHANLFSPPLDFSILFQQALLNGQHSVILYWGTIACFFCISSLWLPRNSMDLAGITQYWHCILIGVSIKALACSFQLLSLPSSNLKPCIQGPQEDVSLLSEPHILFYISVVQGVLSVLQLLVFPHGLSSFCSFLPCSLLGFISLARLFDLHMSSDAASLPLPIPPGMQGVPLC